MAYVRTAISSEPLEIAALIAEAASPSSGAIASFVGTVRVSASGLDDADKPVTRLEYDAHPTLADRKLAEVAGRAAEKWPLERIIAVHRTGTCELGDPTVVIACSSPHRAEALEACHWAIDEVKASVPIWKKEIYSDGSTWVGAENA